MMDTREQHEEGHKAFWDGLPVLLGLSPWSELRKEREEVCVYDLNPDSIR